MKFYFYSYTVKRPLDFLLVAEGDGVADCDENTNSGTVYREVKKALESKNTGKVVRITYFNKVD